MQVRCVEIRQGWQAWQVAVFGPAAPDSPRVTVLEVHTAGATPYVVGRVYALALVEDTD